MKNVIFVEKENFQGIMLKTKWILDLIASWDAPSRLWSALNDGWDDDFAWLEGVYHPELVIEKLPEYLTISEYLKFYDFESNMNRQRLSKEQVKSKRTRG